MEEYLKKVYIEFLEYQNFLQKNVKPIEELREKVLKAITEETTEEEVTELVLSSLENQKLQLIDFDKQLQRLFFTVEAFKDFIEIPQEIKETVKNIRFTQTFSVKSGKAEVINSDSYEFSRQEIRKEVSHGIEQFKKRFL